MQKYTFKEHFVEIKKRLVVVSVFFVAAFSLCYIFHEDIYDFLLRPLIDASDEIDRKVIYTGLAEAFFSYIKLSCFAAFYLIIPLICYQIYAFIRPGLLQEEKSIVRLVMLFSPFLFYIGSFFVFYFVMPKAWVFFLSYEKSNSSVPLLLEAKISEYLDIVIQFMIAFGVAFQLPVVMVILGAMGLVHSRFLQEKRRVSVILIFFVAAFLTPPDVYSQIALALPLVLLYEVSIMLCKLVENRGKKKC